MNKNIAILDANVLFSGLHSSEGASYKALNFLENNKIKIAISIALLFEYEEMLKRNKKITIFSRKKGSNPLLTLSLFI